MYHFQTLFIVITLLLASFLIGVSQPQHYYRNLVNTNQTSQQEGVTQSQQSVKKELSTSPPGPPPPSPPYCEDGKSDIQGDNTTVITSSQRQRSLQVPVPKDCVIDGTDVAVSSPRQSIHHIVTSMKDARKDDVNGTSFKRLSSHQSISSTDDVHMNDTEELLVDSSNGGPSLRLVQSGTCKDSSTKSDAVTSSSCASVTSKPNLTGTGERSQQLQPCMVGKIPGWDT